MTDLDEKLPCDVHLPPATFIRKGCTYRTLMLAIEQRKTYPNSITTFARPADRELAEVSDKLSVISD